ncbi:MAG TPA: SLC13 family permease [Pyrinomonadaceae bacterium]|nr:SLC13 family permease [Pyrinomonadaceae bacterium]
MRAVAESGQAAEQVVVSERARTPVRKRVGRVLMAVVPVAVWFAPLDLEPQAKRALAVASFMIVSWMTEALGFALTGFIGCYLFWALGVAAFGVAFGGFATETPWFCFGALLFGAMATKTGLARRLAYLVISRVGQTHSRVLLGFTLVSLVLTFLVPSGAARVVILAAMALGLMQAYGLGPGTNLGRAVFIVVTYSAGLFDKMIIAGSSSILARGLIERTGGVRVPWSLWFIAFLPCTLLTVFVVWRLALWLFPPEGEAATQGGAAFLREELRRMGGWSGGERKAALLMLAAVGLWATDFLHRASPAMVCLGVGLSATLPRLGVLDSEDVRRLNYLPVFFVAAAAGMSEVLIRTGAIEVLTGLMFAWMGPLVTNAYAQVAVPFWTAVGYHLLLGNNVSMLSTSLPPLMSFAASRGLDPLALGMIWTFTGGCKLFVYQSAVLIVGYSYGYFSGRDLFRFAACLTVVEFVLVLLLATLYWPLIGLG